MILSDSAHADQLEAWVLAGHQRLERLSVPVFGAGVPEAREQQCGVESASMRLLPLLGLPRELCDLDAWLSGSCDILASLNSLVKLSLFFRYLASPLRYEPYSESAIHKAVPSSRGRYPLKFFFVHSVAGRSRAYGYIPEFHALEELPQYEMPVLADGQAALVCVGRAWRYAEEYGEFAHAPCVLEAGHAQSQAQHLARLLQIGGHADPDREYGRILCALPLEIPLFCIGLRPQLDVEGMVLHNAKLAVPRPYPEMETRFPRLHLFQRCFDGGTSSINTLPCSTKWWTKTARRADVGGRGVFGLMRQRTAGNDRGATSSVLSEVPAGTFASLMATWRAIGGQRPTMAVQQELRMSLVWLGLEAGQAPGVFDIDGQDVTTRPWEGDLHGALAQMLPYAHTRYNFATLTAVFIVHVDLLATIERLGADALREVYLAAGAAAQDFSLAATAHDMYARPAKMMREARMESALALPGQAVYLVLCGFARSANPSMELA